MIMHKMTDEMETGIPDPVIVEGVSKLIQEGVKDKVFVSGEGLKPTAERVHISYKGGKRTITNGPFPDEKQLPGGFALMRVRSRDEAISWLDKFAAVVGDVELFMGPIVEPWDLGMLPKPKNPPLRFLSMQEANETASARAPSPEVMQKMGALIDEMTNAGVLQATGALEPTKKGKRLRFEGKKRTVIDGPFAESKELVAGYAIVHLPSLEAAVEWTTRFAEVVKVSEIDIREMPEY